MKLFGNKKNAEHTKTHSARESANLQSVDNPDPEKEQEKSKKFRCTGVQKGIVLLVCAVLILAGTVYGIYKAIVKPVEISKEPVTIAAEDKPVKAPTVIHKVTKVDEESGEEIELETEVPASHQEGVYNILICGTDNDGYRTDTIIVAHLDVNTHQAALMSIPRDTVVSSGSGIMKINSVYAGGKEEGMTRLEGRLGTMLGFPMDGYVLVDLTAFKEIVDLVGGVNFDVPQDMYYNDPTQDLYINLTKGYQLLDGEKAMELVRFRKGYASQDIQRTKVQQDFLKALAKQCVSIGTLTKIKELSDIFYTYVLTDMTVGNMVYFGQELLKCDFDNMKTYTVEGEGAMINGGSYYPLYASSILEIVNESFNPYDVDLTYSNISVITPDVARGYQIVSKPPVTEPPAETQEPTDTETPDSTETPDGETQPPAEDTETTDEPEQTDPPETTDDDVFWE